MFGSLQSSSLAHIPFVLLPSNDYQSNNMKLVVLMWKIKTKEELTSKILLHGAVCGHKLHMIPFFKTKNEMIKENNDLKKKCYL